MTEAAQTETELKYPSLTMFQMIERMALQHPDHPAYDFYGRITSYSRFLKKIEQAARAFAAAGVKKGEPELL